jgi:hypothetical protein
MGLFVRVVDGDDDLAAPTPIMNEPSTMTTASTHSVVDNPHTGGYHSSEIPTPHVEGLARWPR